MSRQEPGKGRERQGKAPQRWAGRETSDTLRFWVTGLNVFSPSTIPPQMHEKTCRGAERASEKPAGRGELQSAGERAVGSPGVMPPCREGEQAGCSACGGFCSPKAVWKNTENKFLELLGKTVFASDFERLVSRFCLRWHFVWGLLFPAHCGGSVGRAGAPYPRVQLSHSLSGCGEQPHRQ